MKRFLVFSLLLLFIPLLKSQSDGVELVREDEQGITLRFKPGKPKFTPVQTPKGIATIISIENGTPILEKGAPDLPKLTQSIIIPQNTKMEIEILDVKVSYVENVSVAPSKGNLYRNVDPKKVAMEYGESYEENRFFPESIANLQTPYMFRDYQGQTVVINPVRYNPHTKLLEIIEELTVLIKPAIGNMLAHTPKTGRINQTFHEIYKKHFLNYGAGNAEYDPVNDWGNMLIIAHDDYLDAMQPYLEWKREKGIPTEIFPMSEVGADENDLLNFVTNYYNDRGLTFLLLVGDEYTIPTIMVNYGGSYSCDNCFSYMEGDDHYPDMFTGRFNAENIAQVQTMVDRSIRYEKSPNQDMPDWFGTGIGIGSNEGQGIGDDGEADWQHQNNIKTQLLGYTYTSVYEYYDGSHANQSPTPGDVSADANGSPNANMINTQIQTVGASLMNYTGHGWEQGVATGSYDVNAVNNMSYNGSYPFFIAVACCTGDFTDNAGGDCLGEAWIRATDNTTGEPTGGIGGLFASIFQSWAPPMQAQDEMTNIITDSVPFQTRHILGGIAANGMASMNDAYNAGGWEMTDTWNFFGDPSIVLWTGNPDTLSASHIASTPIGTDQLTVNCDVEGALISVSQNGILLGTGIVDSGKVVVYFDEGISEIENLTVTATAHNYLPYQGPVSVLIEGAYVVMDHYTIDDSNGNADGEVDYNENISLHIALGNIGLDNAYEVAAVINTSDTLISLIDKSEDWGTISAGAVETKNNAFSFQVADFIPDQHPVKFIISASDSTGKTVETSVSLKVNAPKLLVNDFFLVDSAGGNGNGRMEPGETATLYIANSNTGHSQSTEAIGQLLSNSPWLTLLNTDWSVGTIDKLGQDVLYAAYQLQVADEVPFNASADFEYLLTAGQYNTSLAFSLPVNLIAIDFENSNYDSTLSWIQDEDYPWFLSTDKALEGNYSSKSGNIGNNNTSEMILNVDVLEEGEMSFYFSVSSEPEYDFLYFFLDGTQMGEWSGELDWTKYSTFLTAGEHELKWVYKKDEIFAQGEDAAWVDFINLPLVAKEEVNSTENLFQAKSIWSLYPNPMSEETRINFQLSAPQTVNLTLFNQLGQQIQVIHTGDFPEGNHQLVWNGSHLIAGSYFVKFSTENQNNILKLIKQ